MLLLLPAFVFLLASVQAQSSHATFGCSSFWPTVTPGQKNTIPEQCQLYPGFPEIIGTTNVTVIYTADWEETVGTLDKLDTLAGTIHRAVERSLATYEDLSTPPTIVIILTTLVGPTDGDGWTVNAYEFMPEDLAGSCEVLLYGDWAINALHNNEQQAEQIVAHELYHCMQAERLGNGLNPTAVSWVIEGSADYFSNVIFPSANAEAGDAANYHPDWPIYDHTGNNAYATEIYFQSLEQSRGIVYISDWVLTTKETQSEDQERTRLAGLGGFADDFYLFAQQYSLEAITDTDGHTIQIPNPPVPSQISIMADDDDDTSGAVSLRTVPFTITVYTVSLDPGQTVSISSSAQGNQRVSYRQFTDTVWTSMPSGSVGGADGTLVIPCNSGNPTAIYILFISTEDLDSDTITLTVQQQSQDETCTCNPGSNNNKNKKRGLNRCKTTTSSSASSTPTPSATSASSASSASASTSPSPTATGSCKASNIKTDPCLTNTKTWTLSIPEMEARIEQQLASLSTSVTVNSLSIAGSGTLSITSGANATFSYNSFEIDLDITTEGIDVPTKTVVNGAFDAGLYMTGQGSFCLDVFSGEGTAVETDPITGGFSFDLGPGGGFVEESVVIDYTCGGGKLTMQGYLNGDTAWGPYVYTG